MSLVKARCCDCDKIHEWTLSRPLNYPADFTGDKRVLLTRRPEGPCKNYSELAYESKVEYAPAS